jgi:hypothetical protein
MNIDLTREEVEQIIRRFSGPGLQHPLDLLELGLVQKLQRHFPPNNVQAGTGDLDVVRKYQQFGR